MKTDKNNKPKMVVLTGGHAGATAYALASYIKKTKDWKIIWIGPKSFVEGYNVRGLEEQTFTEMGIKQFFIDAGRLQRKFTRWTIPSLLKIPVGFLQSVNLLRKLKPDAVLSFGGFAGFPVVIAAKMMGIPVAVHEQTMAAGRANIISAKFADMVAISRHESKKYFPEGRTILTGNPVDESILKIKEKTRLPDQPLLFVTGGHTGSRFINSLVEKNIHELLQDFRVVHQTGKIDFERLSSLRLGLKESEAGNYEVYETIEPESWPSILDKSDIIVSRAGANTVAQIMLTRRPSLLIPIHFSYLDEQLKNAVAARNYGIAKVLEEKDADSKRFLNDIRSIRENWQEMVKASEKSSSPDRNASLNLTGMIQKLMDAKDPKKD